MFKSFISSIAKLFGVGFRLVKFVIGFVLTTIIVITAVVVGTYLYYARDLPDIKTIRDYHPPVISEVFDDQGKRIGEFWTECRILVPYNKIPKRVIEAFVDSEDARFFEHKGVDARSIMRAFIANIRAGTITQGGSTITQQITRSLLLTRERKLSRKIKEAILATRLERYLDKEQILMLYLNQIYLGNRAYGVAAAARNYFHKDLNDLSLGQIALIAGLPTAPTTFSPINNPEEARRRQLHVLERMVDEKHITEEEATQIAEEKFNVYVAGTDKSFTDKDAAYFVEHVRRIVKDLYGDDFLYRKGLKIYTTVDMAKQRDGTKAIHKGIEALDRRHGWRGPLGHVPRDQIANKARELGKKIIIRQQGDVIYWPPNGDSHPEPMIDFTPGETYEAVVTTFRDNDAYIQIGNVSGVIKPDGIKWARPYSNTWLGYPGNTYVRDPQKILKVGDIILARRLEDGTFALAQKPLVQSALMAMDPHTGHIKTMVGGYDFEDSEFNRVTQALRQPGSSFKPFVYAAALDKGYTYNTAIMDAPVAYQVGRRKVWRPRNYGGKYKGLTPFQNALKFSRNVPTVKITFDIGTHYLTAYSRKMGLSTPIEKYLSIALGANAVYLKDMVQAYSALANYGNLKPAIAILRIEDVDGKSLQTWESIEKKEGEVTKTKPKPKEEKQKKKRKSAWEEISESMEVTESDLNPTLFREGIETIERDKLILTDLEIKTLYGNQIPSGHVITPQTAYLMVNLLKGVVEGGTGARVRALGKPVAGKTGTTNDETDAWFIGFVPDLCAGVWVGFDELQQIGKGIAGGNTAAPIFLDFMKDATEGWENKEFKKPEGFPHSSLASLTGGSAIFGARPNQSLTEEGGGADRAGRFFEEDLEEIELSYPLEEESERQP